MTLHPEECVVCPSDPYTCIRPDHDDHPARLGQKLSPLPLEGEVIATPPEPPRDHIIASHSGYIFVWSDELDNWLEVDSHYGYSMNWEEVYRDNHPVTVYKPIKELP